MTSRILCFYTSLAFSAPKTLNIVLNNSFWNSWKKVNYFHVSCLNYKIRRKENLEMQYKKMDKKKIQPLEIWEGMTCSEILKVFQCSKDILEILIPNINTVEKLSVNEIIFIAKKLQKKCVMVRSPYHTTKEKKEKLNFMRQSPSKLENLIKRPPIVTVMGHVDHGKTTLLDSLRNSSIVGKEFGGITQHIGAFTVKVKSGQTITFIDTPGHAAFTTMRARGAKVTDIVVLVIAADDGIMEQTIESIKIANNAFVKIIVAVNKIDKPNTFSLDNIKEKLLVEGIQVEERGGEVQIVPISALKKINLDLLTEMILLEADLMNLRGDPTGLVEGVIIESKKDENGIAATIIIQRGTLKKGKILLGGSCYARVRYMLDDNGLVCCEAGPSLPVQVFGWKNLPAAGDEVFEVATEKEATQAIKIRKKDEMLLKQKEDLKIITEGRLLHQKQHNEKTIYIKSLKNTGKLAEYYKEQTLLKQSKKEIKESDPMLHIILKADVHGSIEVLREILNTYNKDDECKLTVIGYGVGHINETDIELSRTFDALIYAFNVNIDVNIKEIIKSENISIHFHNVIYTLIDDLKSELSLRIPPVNTDNIIGEAVVNQNFLITHKKKKIPVAGCKCIKGELRKNLFFKIIRNEKIIYSGTLISMKHKKNEVDTIRKEVECGLMFDSFSEEFKPLDRIICYEILKVSRNTSWDPGF